MSVPSDQRPGSVATAPEPTAVGTQPRVAEPSSSTNAGGADLTRIAVVAGIIVAVGWCLYGLDARPLWLDEAISRNATHQLGETLDRTAATMALYYVVLTGWTALFGDGAAAIRSLSVVFVAATVGVTFLLARRLLGRRAAVAAVILVALLPALTRYGQEARSYALTALIATASWYCLTRAVTEEPAADSSADRASRWWLAVVLLSVLGVFSHGLFLLQVVAQGASLVVARCWGPLRRFVPALVLSGLMGAMLFQSGAKDVANWVPPLSFAQFVDALSLLLGPTWPSAVVTATLVSVGVAASAARFRASLDPIERWKASIPLVWAVGPLLLITVLSTARPYLQPRYVVASLPAIALLLAAGLDHIHRSLTGVGPRATRWTVVVALTVAASLVAGQFAIRSEPAEDWRTAARIIDDGAVAEDRVVFTQPDLKLAFDSAWDELPARSRNAAGVVYPERPLGQLQRFDPPADPERVSTLIADVDRLWVVHRTMSGSGDVLLDRVLGWPAVAEHFHTVDHHRLDGDVHVIVLERQQR